MYKLARTVSTRIHSQITLAFLFIYSQTAVVWTTCNWNEAIFQSRTILWFLYRHFWHYGQCMYCTVDVYAWKALSTRMNSTDIIDPVSQAATPESVVNHSAGWHWDVVTFVCHHLLFLSRSTATTAASCSAVQVTRGLGLDSRFWAVTRDSTRSLRLGASDSATALFYSCNNWCTIVFFYIQCDKRCLIILNLLKQSHDDTHFVQGRPRTTDLLQFIVYLFIIYYQCS